MIAKFIAAAAAAGLVLSVAGNADARSRHNRHHEKSISTHAMSMRAMAAMSGANSYSNLAPQTTPRTPIGKDSTAEAPRR